MIALAWTGKPEKWPSLRVNRQPSFDARVVAYAEIKKCRASRSLDITRRSWLGLQERLGQADQAEARHREDVFRLLVDSVSDYAIFVLDPSGRISTWNSGAERIKGYSAHEILGKHFSVFYPSESLALDVPSTALQIATETGHWENEGWRVRKDGTRFWASVVITALRDTSGGLVGFAKVTRDLTAHRHAEEEREALLAEAVAAREEANRSLDQLKSIQMLTEAALSHIQLDELLADLIDKISNILSADTIAVLLLEDEPDEDGRQWLVARAAKGVEEEVEQGVRIPLGHGFAGSIAAQRKPRILSDVSPRNVVNPLLWEKGVQAIIGVPMLIEGRVIGVLHVGSLTPRTFTDQDVSFLQIVADRVAMAVEHARLIEFARSANEEARAAEEQVAVRDAFLSVAAHELKTPVTTLRLAAQTVHRQLVASGLELPAVAVSLKALDRQSGQLGRLVERLLDRVRLEHGRLQLDFERTDLEHLLEDVVGRIQPIAETHEIRLITSGSLIARVDPLRLDQVFTNLLDNALKFSPDAKGPIEVNLTAPSPGWARVSVADQGLGVPVDRRDHLFERFYQAHEDEHRSGMGIGLWISREIVNRHGGDIHAEFPTDGGTVMVVDLPVEGLVGQSSPGA